MGNFTYAFVLTIFGCFSVSPDVECQSQEFKYQFTTPGGCLGMRNVLLEAFQHHPSFKIDEDLTDCSVVARATQVFDDESSAILAGSEWLAAFQDSVRFDEALNGSVMDLIEQRKKRSADPPADEN